MRIGEWDGSFDSLPNCETQVTDTCFAYWFLT